VVVTDAEQVTFALTALVSALAVGLLWLFISSALLGFIGFMKRVLG
jgi:hypothetical protein